MLLGSSLCADDKLWICSYTHEGKDYCFASFDNEETIKTVALHKNLSVKQAVSFSEKDKYEQQDVYLFEYVHEDKHFGMNIVSSNVSECDLHAYNLDLRLIGELVLRVPTDAEMSPMEKLIFGTDALEFSGKP